MIKVYTLNLADLWRQLKREHFAFWMVCIYFFTQYFDPQQIYHRLDFIPWDKVAFGLAVLALPFDPHRHRVRDSTNVWITLFLIVIILSSEFATYPTIAWSHFFDFFGWYALYFIIINVVTTTDRYFIVLAIFLVANLKLAIFGARTWVSRGFGFVSWGIQGPPGPFQNSADLSTEMLMFSPIAFELALYVKPYAKRMTYWILLGGATAGAMTVLGASSRGAQLTLVIQGAWVAIQKKLKFSVVLAVIALVILGFHLLPAGEKARFMTAGTDTTSLQRLYYWKAGLKMIEQHPILGVGFYNFPWVYARQDPNHLFFGSPQLPHNIFVEVGTDCGLVGLALFLILLYRNFKLSREIIRTASNSKKTPPFAQNVARGLAVATWGFIIAGQFNTVSFYPFIWINLALTVALANIVRRSEGQALGGGFLPSAARHPDVIRNASRNPMQA